MLKGSKPTRDSQKGDSYITQPGGLRSNAERRRMKKRMRRRMIKRRRMVKRRWRSRGGVEEEDEDNQSFRPGTAAALCLRPPAASSHLVSLEGNRETCGASLSSCSTPPPPA